MPYTDKLGKPGKPASREATRTGPFVRLLSGLASSGRPVILAGFAALAFVVLLHVYHGKFKRDITSNFQQLQFETAHGIAGAIEKSARQVVEDLGALSRRGQIVESLPKAQEALRAFYHAHGEVLDSLCLADADGKIIAWSPTKKNIENIPPWRDLAATSKSTGKYATDFADGTRTSSGSIFRVVFPLRHTRGFVGTICCNISIAKLYAASASRPEAVTANTCMIVTPNGNILYSSQPDHEHTTDSRSGTGSLEDQRTRTGTRIADRAILDAVHNSRSGVAQSASGLLGNGISELIAFAPVEVGDTALHLVVVTPASSVSVPISSHERLTYTLVLALSLLYFATGYMCYRGEKARALLEEQRRLTAESTSRAKSEFLAKMSHEIRTPMAGIIGMTDMAMGTELTSEQRKYLNMVNDSADSLLTIINDILDISRIEAGKIELASVSFDVRDCLEDTLRTLEPLAQRKHLKLLLRIDSSVPGSVIGDPGRLRQVVTNLVGNAIKFTEAGRVCVNVDLDSETSEEACLAFAVSDTGIGISAEAKGRIFESFEQGDGSASRNYEGTGLGLAISAQLIEMMAGRIWVESELGQGSTFHFTARFRPQTDSARGSDVAALEVLRGTRVLIADPNDLSRGFLEQTLRHWEMIPIGVAEGKEAVAQLRQAADKDRPFSLVLLEAELSDMEGFVVAKHIKGDPKFAETLVMMMCSAGYRGDAARSQEEGVSAYLTKPVDESLLRDAVCKAYDRLRGTTEDALITHHSLRESLRHLRILVAEDNPVSQEYATLLLQKQGHEVQCVANGNEALALLAKQPFDVILMDVQMPEMDGLEATIAIREDEKRSGRHIPIIAMTADAMSETRRQCLDVGMDDYVSKPVRPEEVLATIGKCVWEKERCSAREVKASASDETRPAARHAIVKGSEVC